MQIFVSRQDFVVGLWSISDSFKWLGGVFQIPKSQPNYFE